MGIGHVFGYGSLAHREAGASLAVAILAGHQRVWDVAMDNTETVPGYKFYVDPISGERPAVMVTFLDLAPTPGADCVGFLVPVEGPTALTALDRRERNYERVEVTDRVSANGPTGRVWTYLASAAGRARYDTGAARGTAVIQSAYIAGVEAAFTAAGLSEPYHASTRPPACPIRDLVRVNDSSRT